VAPPFSWTGFYAGANFGLAREDVTVTYAAPGLPNGFLPADVAAIDAGSSGSLDNTSVTYSIQAGYNLQVWGNWVVGAEIDLGGIGRSNSVTRAFTAPVAGPVTSTITESPNWLLTARGRLGWAFDRLLVYGTGGYAYVDSSFSQTNFYNPIF